MPTTETKLTPMQALEHLRDFAAQGVPNCVNHDYIVHVMARVVQPQVVQMDPVPADLQAQWDAAAQLPATKQGLAEAFNIKHRTSLTAEDIRDIMPFDDGVLHFQATRDGLTDWYDIKRSEAGWLLPATIELLPF